MLFNMLYFVSLPVEQVKRKNSMPEAISTCLGQALILNPDVAIMKQVVTVTVKRMSK